MTDTYISQETTNELKKNLANINVDKKQIETLIKNFVLGKTGQAGFQLSFKVISRHFDEMLFGSIAAQLVSEFSNSLLSSEPYLNHHTASAVTNCMQVIQKYGVSANKYSLEALEEAFLNSYHKNKNAADVIRDLFISCPKILSDNTVNELLYELYESIEGCDNPAFAISMSLSAASKRNIYLHVETVSDLVVDMSKTLDCSERVEEDIMRVLRAFATNKKISLNAEGNEAKKVIENHLLRLHREEKLSETAFSMYCMTLYGQLRYSEICNLTTSSKYEVTLDYWQAEACRKTHDYELSEALCHAVIEKASEFVVEAKVCLAYVYNQTERHDKAYTLLDRLLGDLGYNHQQSPRIVCGLVFSRKLQKAQKQSFLTYISSELAKGFRVIKKDLFAARDLLHEGMDK